MIEKKELLALPFVKQQLPNTLPKEFTTVCIDSRIVKNTDIFFALIGENNDAHTYLADVLKTAPVAVVQEFWYKQNGEKFKDKNLIVVKDTTLALGELASIHRKHINPKIISIGGSNGKTTTKEMLHAVLSKKYNTLKTEGNFNNHIGVPLTLLRLEKQHEWCVLEVGCNHFDEIAYLCKVAEPDYGIITNIGKEHLEFFKNKAGVAKAEFELFDYLRNKKGSICFVNESDAYIKKYGQSLSTAKKYTYSFAKGSDVSGKFKSYDVDFFPTIDITIKDKTHQLKVSTFGKHSIYNGLAIAAVGLKVGVALKDITDALGNFTSGASKRMDVKEVNGIKVINDTYNSNPDSVKLGLETIREYKTKAQKHVVLGDMLELGKVSELEHAKIGTLVSKYKLPFLYTFGPDSLHTHTNAKGVKFNKHYTDKTQLIAQLKKNVAKGDIIYVKGSRGMKMEEVVNAFV